MSRQPRSSAISGRGAWQGILRTCLGPWPIRPALLAVLYGFVNQYSVVRIAEAQEVPIPSAYADALPSTLAQCAALFGGAYLARRLQMRLDPETDRRGVFIACIFFTDAVFSALRFLIVQQDVEQAGVIALRDLVAILIVTAMFGIAGERLASQVRKTQDALDLVASQREQLLIADEAAREEVARYLHDNVQADLVVLAMQLRSQAATLTDLESERLSSVIDELDQVRLLDIRQASRRLNPDIASLGLAATLRELAAGYAPAMTVQVECPLELPSASPEQLLGVYRIAEQGLLNAAIHGKADTCTVLVARDHQAGLVLRVANDGEAVPVDGTAGAGSAIIEAWVSRLHGEWSLTAGEEATVLMARLWKDQ